MVEKDSGMSIKKQFRVKTKTEKMYLEGIGMAMENNYFWHKHEYYKQIKGVGMCHKYAPSVANIFLNKC